MKRSLRFIGNLLFILMMLSVLFSYAMFQGGFVSWFLFYSFSPILLYHLLLIFYPLKGLQITRVISKRVVQAGDSVHVIINVKRKLPIPLYYGLFEELLPETLDRNDLKHHNYTFLNAPGKLVKTRSVKEILVIGFRKSFDITYKLESVPRGEHRLSAVRVFISDVFGFVKKEHIFQLEDELIVRPNERKINVIDTAVSFEQGQTAVHTFQLENTNVATGVREYAPGDRFSWIHWKQTAKNQSVMTKEFEQERSNSLLIALDANQLNRKNPLAFEASVELAVSLMSTLDKTSVEMELMVLGTEIRSFSIRESSMMKEEIRYYLTKIRPDGKQSFSSLLNEGLRQVKRLDRMILITNSMDEWFGQSMLMLRQKTTQITVFYIQGSAYVSDNESEMVARLKKEGTTVHVLTEKELTQDPLEVSIR